MRHLIDELPAAKRPPMVAGTDEQLSALETKNSSGCQLILKSSSAYSLRNPLTIVVFGKATDLAATMIEDPTLEERIQVVAAAFQEWPRGYKELPSSYDIKAWQVIFDSNVPLSIASRGAAELHLKISQTEMDNTFVGYLGRVISAPIIQKTGFAPLKTDQSWALPSLLALAVVMDNAEKTAYRRPTVSDAGTLLHGGSTAPLPCQTCVGEPRIYWVYKVDKKQLFAYVKKLLTKTGRLRKNASGKKK